MFLQKLKSQTVKKSFQKGQSTFSIKTFFSAYISAIKSKALFFNYPFASSKVIYDVLILLEKNNRIAGYKFFPDNQTIRIFLSYDLTQDKPFIPKVSYYSSQGQTKSANFKMLQQFQKQNPHAFTLIGTHRGIMDLKNCLFHKCGGEFLISLS